MRVDHESHTSRRRSGWGCAVKMYCCAPKYLNRIEPSVDDRKSWFGEEAVFGWVRR